MNDVCPWCENHRHDECDPINFFCTCEQGACADRFNPRGEPMTPDPEQTDNRERPEDGEQDVDQSPSLDYSQPGDVDLQDPA